MTCNTKIKILLSEMPWYFYIADKDMYKNNIAIKERGIQNKI